MIQSTVVHMHYDRMLMSHEGSFCNLPFSRLSQNREAFLPNAAALVVLFQSVWFGFFSLLYTAAGRSAVSRSCAPSPMAGVSGCCSGRDSRVNLVCSR